MPGPRQPTDVIVANGKKHLSGPEEHARRAGEVRVQAPEEIVPPSWLLKSYHKEFLEIARILSTAGLYSDLDRDTLAQYFVCRRRWVDADRKAKKGISANNAEVAAAWAKIQASYFKQARQCAEAMGLSVTSRCRLVIPPPLKEPEAPDGDGFLRLLHSRQKAAVGE